LPLPDRPLAGGQRRSPAEASISMRGYWPPLFHIKQEDSRRTVGADIIRPHGDTACFVMAARKAHENFISFPKKRLENIKNL